MQKRPPASILVFVDTASCGFETEILEIQDGAGIGLYFGDSCFDRYILAVVGNGRLEVRIPTACRWEIRFAMTGPGGGIRQRPYRLREPPFRLGFQAAEKRFFRGLRRRKY